MAQEEIYEEVNKALGKAAKGLTARQLLSECESCDDINAMVKVIHELKADGRIRADGMRDSQVVYRLGTAAAPGTAVAPVERPKQPASAPASPPVAVAKQTATTLRQELFDMLRLLKAGKVDAKTAASFAGLSMTILKSLELQIEFAKMVKANELPRDLEDIELVPAEKAA